MSGVFRIVSDTLVYIVISLIYICIFVLYFMKLHGKLFVLSTYNFT